MKRRLREDEVPTRLATFIPEDWPGRTWDDRFAFWKEARRAWHDEYAWPGGPLELMRRISDTRRRRDGQRLLSWGRSPEELAKLNRQQ